MKHKIYIWLGLLSVVLLVGACQPPGNMTAINGANTNAASNTAETAGQSLIKAAPVEKGENGYQFITGDDFKLTVHAPDASEVTVLYQPVTASDRALKLQTLDAPTDAANNNYVADVKVPEDFNGDVWAQIKYKNGDLKETEHLLMAKRDAAENGANDEQARNNSNSNNAANSNGLMNSNSNAPNQNGDTQESARSDKMTGGKIEKTTLKPGDGNVKITVNVPAFTMTFWQNGKEIKSYYVGVGRKDFPIPIGMRSANKVILNPNWIPPNSEWVRKSSSVEPYETITADDPQNPLGKIKIPLGDAYLLHEADAPSDIGNLVSHGCVRVLREDMFGITEMIAQARNLPITKQEIEAAKNNTDRKVISLNGDVPVDINYDSMVVE
ncbi:MAG: L,D-transpeptidase, partial [Acidobacteriota bacterium]